MGGGSQPSDTGSTEGRYPSNVVFDETEAERLDRKVGETVSEGGSDASAFANGGMFADDHERDYDANPGYGDTGGPSRYFYTSKASKSERTANGKIDNTHPTVKPVDLMEWLVTLVTKENQTVLDPFCGSGTTGKACKHKNREFIGIEKQANWADVARVRCGLTPEDPSVVREDDSQQGLEQF
jgi:site-specific DNA-methyltransferase (adenine-specific)